MRLNRGEGDDRGAVVVLFALLATGLIALGALMFDVAAVYVEGRQLQNGAENAALAIARSCASGSGSACSTTVGNGLANLNALDQRTQVEDVLICTPGPGNTCTPGVRDRFGCRPVSGTAPYVQVHTRSLQSDGSAALPAFFLRAIRPTQATPVRACARAAYGTPSGLRSELPLALSLCEHNYWISEYQRLYGARYVTEPYPAGSEVVLYFHSQGDLGGSTCTSSTQANSTQQYPGGFGWLDVIPGTCEVATSSTGTANGDGGNNPPHNSDCAATDLDDMHGQIVHVPVFGAVTATGGNRYSYDILDYDAFQLTGYRLNGGAPAYTRPSPTLGMPCPASTTCIIGRFVQDPAPAAVGSLVPATGFGVIAVKSVG